jgi:hypothetical protein
MFVNVEEPSTETKLCGFSPQANYTDRATAAVSTLADRGCRVVRAMDPPTAVNLDFLDLEPLLFQLCSSSVILTRLS